jgi:hypothetical protein
VTDAFVAVEVGKMITRLPLEGYDKAVVEKLLRLVSCACCVYLKNPSG